MSIVSVKIEFWAKHGKNVLLIGESGVGKTGIIKDSLEHYGYKFGEDIAYYSTHSSDFVGDPTKAKLILFDNLNDPLAQKAAQEVSGLRIWKGIPVTACVWGCWTLNDEDTENGKYEYTPDIANCFEVKIIVPSRPNESYMKEKFGERLTKAAIQWWEDLDYEYRRKVSPKCLTDALVIYQQRGDMRDILPVNCNVSKLTTALNTGPITEKLDSLMKGNDDEATKKFLAEEYCYNAAIKFIPLSETLMTYFLPRLPEVKLCQLMADDDKVAQFVIDLITKDEPHPYFVQIAKKIMDAPPNWHPYGVRLGKRIRRALEKKQTEIEMKKNENINQ